MSKDTIFLYTSGKKPFVDRFFQAHKEQAKRLNLNFTCVSSLDWGNTDSRVVPQSPAMSSAPFAGLLEGILQGVNELADESLVFLRKTTACIQTPVLLTTTET